MAVTYCTDAEHNTRLCTCTHDWALISYLARVVATTNVRLRYQFLSYRFRDWLAGHLTHLDWSLFRILWEASPAQPIAYKIQCEGSLVSRCYFGGDFLVLRPIRNWSVWVRVKTPKLITGKEASARAGHCSTWAIWVLQNATLHKWELDAPSLPTAAYKAPDTIHVLIQ